MIDLTDYDAVYAEFVRICEANPDKVNPMDGATCVYTSPDDPNDHCLAGEFLAQHGLLDRPYSMDLADTYFQRVGASFQVAELARRFQARADYPCPWGKIPEIIKYGLRTYGTA